MCETVLITGVGGPAGRAGASYFANKGYRVVGTDVREVASPATDFRFVPAARDPRFVAVLLAMAVREKAALVVSTVTEELPVVARMRTALRERGIAFCISDPSGVDVANDKLRTAEDLDRGGRGVVVHHGADDLACASPEEVVWQEFLSGEEYDLNLFVERDGSVPAAVVLRKTGLKDGLVGNALGVERVERPDVAGVGMRAARSLGLEGPIDMDIRLSADGSPAVLEVNARLGANVLSASEVLDALDEAWRNGRCA